MASQHRLMVGIGYVADQVTPSVIVQNTYSQDNNGSVQGYIRVAVLDHELRTQYSVGGPEKLGSGHGAHEIQIVDVDDDGNDEILVGPNAFDFDGAAEDGYLKWTLADLFENGHADRVDAADVQPWRPGLETWLSHEYWGPACATASDMILADAATGEVLLQIGGMRDNTGGLIVNLSDEHDGMELVGMEESFQDENDDELCPRETHVFTAEGAEIGSAYPPRPLRWLGGSTIEGLRHSNIVTVNADGTDDQTLATLSDWGAPLRMPMADIFGDHREEIVAHGANESSASEGGCGADAESGAGGQTTTSSPLGGAGGSGAQGGATSGGSTATGGEGGSACLPEELCDGIDNDCDDDVDEGCDCIENETQELLQRRSRSAGSWRVRRGPTDLRHQRRLGRLRGRGHANRRGLQWAG